MVKSVTYSVCLEVLLAIAQSHLYEEIPLVRTQRIFYFVNLVKHLQHNPHSIGMFL